MFPYIITCAAVFKQGTIVNGFKNFSVLLHAEKEATGHLCEQVLWVFHGAAIEFE